MLGLKDSVFWVPANSAAMLTVLENNQPTVPSVTTTNSPIMASFGRGLQRYQMDTLGLQHRLQRR